MELSQEHNMINTLIWLSITLWFLWITGALNLLSVPFYIPVFLIVLVLNLVLWIWTLYLINSSNSYYFQNTLFSAILTSIYLLFLPLGFLSGLFFAIPTVYSLYYFYTGYTLLSSSYYAYIS